MTPCANEVSNGQNFESYEVAQTLAAEPVPGSDADLVKRMHARDAEALAATFDRYGRVVFSVILRVVRDSATAEDLVQETFLRVWNRVCGFDIRKGSMGPWVLAIAHNCAIDYLRSSVGRHRQVVAFDESDHPALHTDMEREILGSDREEDDIGVSFPACQRVATVYQLGRHSFAVTLIHLASVSFDKDARHSRAG